MEKEPLEINYVFYLSLLAFSIFFTTLTVTSVPCSKIYPKAFFLFYSFSEIVLEVLGVALLGWLTKKKFSKKLYYIFIGTVFLFFIRHLIDFFVFKILDITLWDGLGIALDENLENFFEMLHVTGVPYFVWAIIFISFLILPFVGIIFYKFTDKISKRKKIKFNSEHIIQTFLCLPLAMLIWDFTASESINPNTYSEFQRSLPWKNTFLQPTTLRIEKPLTLKKPKQAKTILSLIEKKDLKTDYKPNIFLFIIESLRDDFITEDISPNLYKFKNENISFKNTIANANATQLSWFSLFYSEHPFSWTNFKNSKNNLGSYSINILKKMGYNINVFTSPELIYYNMGEILFGKKMFLVDNFQAYPHYHPVEAHESDKLVTEAMIASIKKDSNLYVGFFDSTHFLYSWPKDFGTKFQPVALVESLNAYTSKNNIDLIKNRYKNSIRYIDHLISKVFDDLKQKDLYDDSIIIVLGDHGEEFYEKGFLFHASQLSKMQTKIPIFIKLGKNKRDINFSKKTFCHLDVFPTIFDYIFNQNKFKDIFVGESIFDKESFPFVITSRYNASRAPFEFFVHTGDEKITFRFKNKKNIYKKQHLEIVSVKDDEDNEMDVNLDKVKKIYSPALEKLFK